MTWEHSRLSEEGAGLGQDTPHFPQSRHTLFGLSRWSLPPGCPPPNYTLPLRGVARCWGLSVGSGAGPSEASWGCRVPHCQLQRGGPHQLPHPLPFHHPFLPHMVLIRSGRRDSSQRKWLCTESFCERGGGGGGREEKGGKRAEGGGAKMDGSPESWTD